MAPYLSFQTFTTQIHGPLLTLKYANSALHTASKIDQQKSIFVINQSYFTYSTFVKMADIIPI
jgi:hypothetical protein